MPITKSAKKALRVSDRKRSVNDRTKKVMKEGIKKVQKLAGAKSTKETKASLSEAYAVIDKAVKKGVIKKNTAARKKSQLARITKESK